MDNEIAFRILRLVEALHDEIFAAFKLVVIVVVVVSAGILVAGFRKATWAVRRKPRILLAYTTNVETDKAFRAVLEYALQSRYDIDHIDYEKKHIILSEDVSLVSWGFFYPVYVWKDDSRGTVVQVGAVSRAVQIGPIVGYERQRCFNSIKSAIWLHERGND